MSAADTMRESLKDYGTPLPSPSSPPESESKARAKAEANANGKSSSEGPGEMVQTCDECHRKKKKCHSSHSQLPSPVLTAATRSAEPHVPGTPGAFHAAAHISAPVNTIGIGASDISHSLGGVHDFSGLRAWSNVFDLQSPLPSVDTYVSGVGLKHQSWASSSRAAPSSTFLDEPAPPSFTPTTGAANRPTRTVTLFVTAANVPAHLKVMPSQGNPNGSAPAHAPAPAAAPTAVPTAAASRAPSAAPTPSAMPTEAAEHGAATRIYMNTKVTYHLLAGMKELAKQKPENPLRVLGEFLLARSAQYETGFTNTNSTAAGTSDAAGEDNTMGEE